MKTLQEILLEKLKVSSKSRLDDIQNIFTVKSFEQFTDVLLSIVNELSNTEYDLTNLMYSTNGRFEKTDPNAIYLVLVSGKIAMLSTKDDDTSVYISWYSFTKHLDVSSIRINASRFSPDKHSNNSNIESSCYLFKCPPELEYMYYEGKNHITA